MPVVVPARPRARSVWHAVRRAPRTLAAASLLVGAVAVAAPTTHTEAAAPAWTLPLSPPKCTKDQADTGDVAGCVLMASSSMPEDRGWPAPPFPEPMNQTVVDWVDLKLGSSGPTVAKVQTALNAAGASLSADGSFGYLTLNAVKDFQTANGLTVTGTVDKAMADLLKVQNTTGGTFPPTGWKWLGWGYNASPALSTWEKGLLGNQKAIGSMRIGQLRAFREALPLFENFYAEIQAKGYVIGDGGTYVFRCTASTRKDCAGLTRGSLSNHAYGLASDINTAKNPMKTYYPVNGVTACATPVITDMPQWVIQTAEKWGLYWGGYGWSSGCTSLTQWRSAISRDPMHFEFNGSPAQARAIMAHNLGSGACLQRVDEKGVEARWCLYKGETPAPGFRQVISTTPPLGATAALIGIVTTGVVGPGNLTAEDCAARPAGTRQVSTAVARVGKTTATSAIVQLDADGRFCLYQSGTFHTVVDVQGYLVPSETAPDGALYHPVDTVIVADTTSTGYCMPDGTCAGPGSVPGKTEMMGTVASTYTPVAAVADLTAVSPLTAGYMSADRCDALDPAVVTHSNLNYTPADSPVTNFNVIATAATELGVQFCWYATSQSHHRVDVTGFFTPPTEGGYGYEPSPTARLLDTRKCATDPITQVQTCATRAVPGTPIRVAAPAGASVVVVDLTAAYALAPGTLTGAACSTFSRHALTSPTVQTLANDITENLAFIPVDPDGTFCVQTSSAMHVTVDLVGVFSNTADGRYVPVTQVRLVDTRRPG